MRAPPYPIEGVVSWNMNTTCNYRCSYCTQRFVDDRGQWARDLPRFVEGLVRLPGDWEVKLSGGEPFRHPGFLDAVGALAEGGLRVSAVTNFSSPRATLEAFARLTSERPGLLSASLHLEYDEPGDFLDRLAWFQGLHRGTCCVTCVATRGDLPRLPGIRRAARERGLRFVVQPEKQDRDVVEYSDDEVARIQALSDGGAPRDVAPNFRGRPCWAGSRYFIVDHRGSAYRCYPARRYRQEALGNLADGDLRLYSEARFCAYEYCNCSVPQRRGMVAGARGETPCSPGV